jgi:putative tricarboxylic transport membrane protein
MKQADLVSGGIGVAIGTYAIWDAQHMPEDVVMKIGPGFFPTILAGGLIIFSVMLIFNALRGRSKGNIERLRLSDPGVRKGLFLLVAAALFCAALKPLGFIPTAVIFMLVMMLVLGNRKPLALTLAPLIVTLGVWAIFEKLLHLNLPAGVLASILG